MNKLLVTAMCIWAANSLASAAEETLQNDGFTDGAAVNFQAGFVSGEVAAARFVPQLVCPCVVESITLLFGGAAETREMGVQVWEDAAGSDAPGSLLFTGTTTLTGSNVNLQVIDLSLTPIIVNGPFRVGLEFGHNGLPSVATDLDGTINAGANFILADIGVLFWFQSATLGVGGDFVIRATIDDLVANDTDSDGVADSVDNCTAIPNANQEDTDGDGFGNICDGDLNNSCFVNFTDLQAFAKLFGPPGAGTAADFDSSGFVSFADLAIFANLFGEAPGPSGVPNICEESP